MIEFFLEFDNIYVGLTPDSTLSFLVLCNKNLVEWRITSKHCVDRTTGHLTLKQCSEYRKTLATQSGIPNTGRKRPDNFNFRAIWTVLRRSLICHSISPCRMRPQEDILSCWSCCAKIVRIWISMSSLNRFTSVINGKLLLPIGLKYISKWGNRLCILNFLDDCNGKARTRQSSVVKIWWILVEVPLKRKR